MATKINDASNFGALLSTGRQVVRDSNGYLWAVLIDDTNNDLELWRSTNGGTTWTEQDSSNSPFAANYDSDDACALAIDSEDTLHIVHAQYDFSPTAITTIKYYTFSSGSWSSEENIQSYADLIAGTQQIDIAIDSNDIPHVAYTMPSLTSDQIRYANRIGGSWSTVSVAGGSGYVHLGVSITLNNKDVPIIAYVQDLTVTDYVYGSLGNQNDATSWSHRAISSTSNATLGTDGVSVAIDSSGNAWVAYVDSDQSICIAVQSSNWTNAWTTSDSGTTGSEPSLVIDGTDKYVFYRDASGNITYQLYDGSWSGETDLQTGTYQDVKARWAIATQYDSSGALVSSLRTYYFNDSTPSDPDSAWSSDANAFDGNTATEATIPQNKGDDTPDTDELYGQGTNAPASGGTIVGVKARMLVQNNPFVSTDTMYGRIYTASLAETLGTMSVTSGGGTATWSSVVSLSTPTGGWTWAKIQNLEIKFYTSTSSLSAAGAYRGEVIVQTSDSPAEIDYLYSDATDVYWDKLALVTPSTLQTDYFNVNFATGGTEEATHSPVTTSLTVVTPTTSYVQVESNTPNAVSTTLTVITPTVSYVQVESNTPNPVTTALTVVAPTTDYVSTHTRTPDPVSATLTVVSPTTSYVQVESDTPNAVSTALTVVAPTSSYVQVESNTPNAVTTALTVVAPTSDYSSVWSDTPNSVTTSLSVVAPTTSYVQVGTDTPNAVATTLSVIAPIVTFADEDSPTPIVLQLAVQAPTVSYVQVESATHSPVTTALTVPAPTSDYSLTSTTTPNPVSTTLSVVTPTTSYVQVESDTPNAVATSLSVVTPTSSYVQVESATHTALSTALTVVAPTSTAQYTGTPDPISTSLTVITPTSSYQEIATRSHNALSTTLSVITPISTYADEDSPTPVILQLTVATPSVSYVQVETDTPNPVSTTLSVATPTSSYVQVESDTPSAIATSLSVIAPTTSYVQVETATHLPVSTALSVVAPTSSYVQVESDTPNAVAITLSTVTPASGYSEGTTANPTPVSLTITPIAPETSYVFVGSDTPDPVAITLSPVTPVSTFSDSDSPTPVVLQITPKTPSVSYIEVGSDTPDSIPTALSVITPTSSYLAVYSDTPDPVVITGTIPAVSSSYVEEYTGSTNPIVLTISNPQATWDHVVQSSYEATVDPILLTFSIPSISPYALVNVFETSPNEIFVKNKLKIKISGDLYT